MEQQLLRRRVKIYTAKINPPTAIRRQTVLLGIYSLKGVFHVCYLLKC